MKLTVDPKTNEFTITGKITDLTGTPSASGKNMTVGFQQFTRTDEKLSNGKPVSFSATICTPNADYVPVKASRTPRA